MDPEKVMRSRTRADSSDLDLDLGSASDTSSVTGSGTKKVKRRKSLAQFADVNEAVNLTLLGGNMNANAQENSSVTSASSARTGSTSTVGTVATVEFSHAVDRQVGVSIYIYIYICHSSLCFPISLCHIYLTYPYLYRYPLYTLEELTVRKMPL